MKKKITIIYLFFGMLSVGLVGFVIYNSLIGVLVSESVMATETAVNQSGRYLEIYVDKLKLISNTIVDNRDVIEYLSNQDEQPIKVYETRIDELIETLMNSDSNLQSIIIISKDGKVFSNEDNLDMDMSGDMMKEAWYVQAIHNDMPTLTSARMQQFSMDKDLWVISLSQEIVDEDGQNIGVAVIDVPYTALETYLMNLHLGEAGYVFILDENDDVVFHKDKAYYEVEALKKSLVQVKNELVGYDRDSAVLINHYEMNNTTWTLVAVNSMDALAVLRRQVLETVLLGISIVLVVVIVTSVILNRLTNEIKSREQEIHRYEMNAMYSQINPHFLYNTLDTIVWMAEFNQKEDIIKITKSLARFFRLSLNKGRETTSLENEIEHVKQYLNIQKQRYQERLEYEIDVDDKVMGVIVPKIILQPVVENSIYHGIKDMDGNGIINIHANAENGNLIITVSDNGIGFDQEGDSLPVSTKTKLGGVGLDNVDQRIKLFCGIDYGLQIVSAKNKGTCVTLKLCIKEK